MTKMICLIAGAVIGAGAVIAVSKVAAAPVQDAVTLSPQYYTVKVDNDRVRVLEFRFKPGSKEPMHTHIPYVVYFLSGGTIRTTVPGGAVTVSAVKQGDASYRDALSHSTENIGNTDVHALIVELKPGIR